MLNPAGLERKMNSEDIEKRANMGLHYEDINHPSNHARVHTRAQMVEWFKDGANWANAQWQQKMKVDEIVKMTQAGSSSED